jgi:hypothetical protein
MKPKTQDLKASNDQAIAAWDLEIERYQALVLEYKGLGQTQVPKPEDRKPGTWGAGKSQA